MKKILYLSDVDIYSPGGAQESMKILMKELSTKYEFYLISPRGKEIDERHIVLDKYTNFILRGKKLKELFFLCKDIFNAINTIKPDIIHIQMPSTLVITNILLTLGFINRKTRVIYTDRGVYGKYGRITTNAINSIIKKADKVVTTTEVNKNNYKKLFKNYNKYEDKFEVIYNTAGKSFDNYEESKRNIVRERYNIKKEHFVIGFCGRYSEQKNWTLTYTVIEELNKQFTDLKFIVVLGSDGTEENYKSSAEYIESLKVNIGEDKIKSFLNITNEEMSEVYYAMDCFILTSKWESFGRTAVEAMARKNVVIGTGVDGLKEVIGRREHIFSTIEEVLDIVEFFLHNNKKLLESKKYFYNRYHTEFGYKRNVKNYDMMYEKLLR